MTNIRKLIKKFMCFSVKKIISLELLNRRTVIKKSLIKTDLLFVLLKE